MNSVNLMYSGGSGGYFLLHLLLLSQEYHCVFSGKQTLEEIIHYQWTIANPSNWKDYEVFPINQLTHTADTKLKKVYFYCNPIDYPEFYGSNNVVLYTDFESQMKLSLYKKAHWFVGKKSVYVNETMFKHRSIIEQWRTYYNNVRDTSWPPCPSIKNFYKLPEFIQQELLAKPTTQYFLNCDYQALNSVDYQGIKVDTHIVDYLKTATVKLYLQDLVNSGGQLLVEQGLIHSVNSDQIKFIQHWKNLHPRTLLDQIAIR